MVILENGKIIGWAIKFQTKCIHDISAEEGWNAGMKFNNCIGREESIMKLNIN